MGCSLLASTFLPTRVLRFDNIGDFYFTQLLPSAVPAGRQKQTVFLPVVEICLRAATITRRRGRRDRVRSRVRRRLVCSARWEKKKEKNEKINKHDDDGRIARQNVRRAMPPRKSSSSTVGRYYYRARRRRGQISRLTPSSCRGSVTLTSTRGRRAARTIIITSA